MTISLDISVSSIHGHIFAASFSRLSGTAECNTATQAAWHYNEDHKSVQDKLSDHLPVSEVIEELSTVEFRVFEGGVLSETVHIRRVSREVICRAAFRHWVDPDTTTDKPGKHKHSHKISTAASKFLSLGLFLIAVCPFKIKWLDFR